MGGGDKELLYGLSGIAARFRVSRGTVRTWYAMGAPIIRLGGAHLQSLLRKCGSLAGISGTRRMGMDEAKIVDEIWKALNTLPKTPRPLSHIISQALYDEAEACGGLSDLLGTIGSWGDTLDDEYIAQLLEDYNSAS